MSTGAVSAEDAIVARVHEILTDHLAAEVAVVAADLGVSVTAPDPDTGMSTSRVMPRDHSRALRIFVDSADEIDEMRVIGAAARQVVILRVACHLGEPRSTDVEKKLSVLATAVRRVVLRYIHAASDAHDPRVYKARFVKRARSSSVRERYASLGMTTRGRGMESSTEQLDVVFEFHQLTAQTISFSDP